MVSAVRLHRVVALLLLGASGSVLGHALLDHAAPPVGSTLNAIPDQVRIWFAQHPRSAATNRVRLWFTEKVEPEFSGIEVHAANGARVDDGNVVIDPNDATSLSVGLRPLSPGTYTVHWHVVSVDTHRTEGTLSFVVAK